MQCYMKDNCMREFLSRKKKKNSWTHNELFMNFQSWVVWELTKINESAIQDNVDISFATLPTWMSSHNSMKAPSSLQNFSWRHNIWHFIKLSTYGFLCEKTTTQEIVISKKTNYHFWTHSECSIIIRTWRT